MRARKAGKSRPVRTRNPKKRAGSRVDEVGDAPEMKLGDSPGGERQRRDPDAERGGAGHEARSHRQRPDRERGVHQVPVAQQHRGGDRAEEGGAREVGCQGQSRQLRGREGRQQNAEEADPGHAGGERPAPAAEARDGERQHDGSGQQQRPERGFRTAPSREEPERHRRRRAPRHEAEIPLRDPVDTVDDSGGQAGSPPRGGRSERRRWRRSRSHAQETRRQGFAPGVKGSRAVLVAGFQRDCRTVVRPFSPAPCQTWKDSPQPQLETAFGLLKRNPAPMMSST